jgi:hypothetical protein
MIRMIVGLSRIGLCVLFVAIQQLPSNAQSAKPEAAISVEWQVAKDQVADVQKAVSVKEAQAYDTRNPILIGAVILVGAAVLPQIAQAVIDVYYRYQSGGVIIDLTKEPMLISTSNRISPGFALIISKNGNQLLEVGGVKPLKVEDLIPILKAAGLKG